MQGTRLSRPPYPDTRRAAWADIAKGICIILVVLCHAVNGVLNAQHAAPGLWGFFDRLAYAFMVPVFFFLSGWFSEKSAKSLKRRWIAIAATLVYPFLLWANVQELVTGHLSGLNSGGGGYRLSAVLAGPLQFWFFVALIGITVLDILARYFSVRGLGRFTVAVAVYILADRGILPSWHVLTIVAQSWLYFEAGVLMANLPVVAVSGGSRLLIVLMGGFLLVLCELAGIGYGTSFRPIAAFSGIAACLALSSLLAQKGGTEWLEALGKYSLSIYCLHLFFTAGVRVGMNIFHWNNVYLVSIVGGLAGVVVPFLIAKADERWWGWAFRWPVRSGKREPGSRSLQSV